MKRALALSLAAVMLLALAGCGVSQEVKDVQDQIAAIGEVTVDSEQAIAAAEAAYEALPAEEQEKVKNADVLTAARESLVMAFIDAIGEVTVDSEQAVTAAEAAYEALPAERRANIANADVLTAARVSLDNEKFKASLAGQWMEMGSFGETPYLTVGEDGVTREGSGTFPLEDVDAAAKTAAFDAQLTKITLALDDSREYPVLTATVALNGRTVTLMRAEDWRAWGEENLTAVEITADNLSEYIGEQTYLADALDEWGDSNGFCICYLPSLAYDKGLVYVGCSEDFALKVVDEWGNDIGVFSDGISPYTPYFGYTVEEAAEAGGEPPTPHLLDAAVVNGKGTLYYLPAEKVADVSYAVGEGRADRVVTTTDGYVLTDVCDIYNGASGQPFYRCLADADIQF